MLSVPDPRYAAYLRRLPHITSVDIDVALEAM